MSTAGANPAGARGSGPDSDPAPNQAPAGPGPSPWDDAVLAAVLMTVDPVGTGGVSLRALAGPVRDQWLTIMRDLQPPDAPQRRIPLHVSDGRVPAVWIWPRP